MPGGQPVADRGQRGGILAEAKPVIERLEGDLVVGSLLLGPLVAVEIHPHGKRRVRDGLDARRTPIAIGT
jgi:hypothetical protein